MASIIIVKWKEPYTCTLYVLHTLAPELPGTLYSVCTYERSIVGYLSLVQTKNNTTVILFEDFLIPYYKIMIIVAEVNIVSI